MHSKLPSSNPLDIRKCESLGTKYISDLLHPLVSYKVVLAVVLAGFAFGAQATVEKSGANAEVQGRDDPYNWQWDGDNARHTIDVVPEAASSIRDDTSGHPNMSILRSYGFKDDVNVLLKTNNAASRVVYDFPLYGVPNSSTDGITEGPSIYSVFGFYADTDADGNGTYEPQSPDINAEMGALWLDVYDNYESGYIFMENKGNTGESITFTDTDIQIKDDLQGTYGWGFVPGIINIVNSGYSVPCWDDSCGSPLAYQSFLFPGRDSGDITFNVTGGDGAQINVQQIMFYGDPAVPDAMSIALPWRAAGAAVSLTANGGAGGQVDDVGNPGGQGGAVELNIQDYRFNIAPHKPLATPISRDFGVFTALNAVSKGGNYGHSSVLSDRYGFMTGLLDTDTTGLNGDGGAVTVVLDQVRIASCGGTKTAFCNASDSTYATTNVIGLNAASLGGASQAYIKAADSTDGVVLGLGGDVSVTLDNQTVINLPFNNSVGVVATSTGDQTLLKSGTQDIYGLSDGTPGEVVVKILKQSRLWRYQHRCDCQFIE
jgi:hypothetical protein